MRSHILIVDDNEYDRYFIAHVISKEGHPHITFAHTGQEAIDIATHDCPDLAIIDIELPDMLGFEVCRRLKQDEGLKTKVILISGEKELVDVATSKASGAVDFVPKTGNYSALTHSVRDLMRE